jgi:hypothetical protein
VVRITVNNFSVAFRGAVLVGSSVITGLDDDACV